VIGRRPAPAHRHVATSRRNWHASSITERSKPGPLPYPMPNTPSTLAPGKTDLLAAPYGGGGEIFVQAGNESDIALQKGFRAPQLMSYMRAGSRGSRDEAAVLGPPRGHARVATSATAQRLDAGKVDSLGLERNCRPARLHHVIVVLRKSLGGLPRRTRNWPMRVFSSVKSLHRQCQYRWQRQSSRHGPS